MARTKLVIHDDIIQPRPQITISFSGIKPEKFYHEIPKILAAVFRSHTGSIQEKRSQFTKGETEKYSTTWELFKDLDKFSYYQIDVDLSTSSTKGSGHATIKVAGGLRTEYPQDTYWERSLLYEVLRMMWHSMFYQSQRERWLKDGRRMVAVFIEELKKLGHAE